MYWYEHNIQGVEKLLVLIGLAIETTFDSIICISQYWLGL